MRPRSCTTRPTRRRTNASSTCAPAHARRPTAPTSRTAPTTNSGSTTCATTWWGTWRTACSASCTTPSSTRRSEEHTSELQSLAYLVCRLLLEKKKRIPERPPAHSIQTHAARLKHSSRRTRGLQRQQHQTPPLRVHQLAVPPCSQRRHPCASAA